MMKRLLQNLFIIGCFLLVIVYVDEAMATETNEKEIITEDDDSEVIVVKELPSVKEETGKSPDRKVKFDTIYEVDEVPVDEASNNQNVLSPAEPKDEMIEEITNKDREPEKVGKTETQDDADALDSDNVEKEDTKVHPEEDSEEDSEENTKEEQAQQPVYSDRGKITHEGLIYLDDTVNRVMSEKIIKSPVKKEPKTSFTSDDKRKEALIRDKMTNFLSFQSLNNKSDKAFVRNLVVESIVVKITSATKLPL